MNRILFIILLTVPNLVFGQSWTKTFGGPGNDYGHSVQQTIDGGYIIAGFIGSHANGGLNDVYLIKTDGNGNELWNRKIGGPFVEGGNSVQQTTDGGYIIAGYSKPALGNYPADVFLIKMAGNGNQLWNKTFGGLYSDVGRSVQQTIDGGYIITGITNSYGNGYDEVYLIKVDASGDSLWTKTFGGIDATHGNSIRQTNDGGYIIAGASYGSPSNVYLLKANGNGDSLWTKTFVGSGGNNYGYSVQQTTDGGYIIAGNTYSFTNGDSDVYLIKTDGNGDSLWTKTFGGLSSEVGFSVQQTNDGGYIITGWTDSYGNGNGDVYLIKTNGNGDSLWTKTFGGTNNDQGNSVQQTNDGGYIITGSTDSYGNGLLDVFLIKTDSQGNITLTINGPKKSRNKLEKVFDIFGRETSIKSNQFLIYNYDDGSTKKKLIID